jgi:hypothetical protein
MGCSLPREGLVVRVQGRDRGALAPDAAGAVPAVLQGRARRGRARLCRGGRRPCGVQEGPARAAPRERRLPARPRARLVRLDGRGLPRRGARLDGVRRPARARGAAPKQGAAAHALRRAHPRGRLQVRGLHPVRRAAAGPPRQERGRGVRRRAATAPVFTDSYAATLEHNLAAPDPAAVLPRAAGRLSDVLGHEVILNSLRPPPTPARASARARRRTPTRATRWRTRRRTGSRVLRRPPCRAARAAARRAARGAARRAAQAAVRRRRALARGDQPRQRRRGWRPAARRGRRTARAVAQAPALCDQRRGGAARRRRAPEAERRRAPRGARGSL